jgi:hypothetical protein
MDSYFVADVVMIVGITAVVGFVALALREAWKAWR